MQPHNINTLNDFASNGWEKLQLHKLTQVLRQNDMAFGAVLKLHTDKSTRTRVTRKHNVAGM